VVYALHATLSYVLMCAVMSYNVAVFVAVIVGSGLGYGIFSSAHLVIEFLAPSRQQQEQQVEEVEETDIHVAGPSGAIVTLRCDSNSPLIVHATDNTAQTS
jgi:hypothetical protein